MLLDLYGMTCDARVSYRPGEFRPERFRQSDGSAFNFIPQGGGHHHNNHRCAVEWITIELVKWAVPLLTESMKYEVPAQDLPIDLSRLPTTPKSRFVIGHVRQIEGHDIRRGNNRRSPHRGRDPQRVRGRQKLVYWSRLRRTLRATKDKENAGTNPGPHCDHQHASQMRMLPSSRS